MTEEEDSSAELFSEDSDWGEDADIPDEDPDQFLDGTYLERQMTRVHIQMLGESNEEADDLLVKITDTWREVRRLRESAIELLDEEGKREKFRKAVKNFRSIYTVVCKEYMKLQNESNDRIRRVDELLMKVQGP